MGVECWPASLPGQLARSSRLESRQDVRIDVGRSTLQSPEQYSHQVPERRCQSQARGCPAYRRTIQRSTDDGERACWAQTGTQRYVREFRDVRRTTAPSQEYGHNPASDLFWGLQITTIHRRRILEADESSLLSWAVMLLQTHVDEMPHLQEHQASDWLDRAPNWVGTGNARCPHWSARIRRRSQGQTSGRHLKELTRQQHVKHEKINVLLFYNHFFNDHFSIFPN